MPTGSGRKNIGKKLPSNQTPGVEGDRNHRNMQFEQMQETIIMKLHPFPIVPLSKQ